MSAAAEEGMTVPPFDRIDPAAFSHEDRYKFLTATVVPRPIALVTSQGSSGVLNAAPYSQFIIIAASPALLGIVAGQTADGDKDTMRNIRETGEYVINTVSEDMADQVQLCAHPFPADVSEVSEAGFSTVESVVVKPRRIAQAPIQFECRLHRMIEFGTSRATLIVGEAVLVHAARGLVSEHRVDHAKLRPLGRISGRRYCLTRDTVDA